MPLFRRSRIVLYTDTTEEYEMQMAARANALRLEEALVKLRKNMEQWVQKRLEIAEDLQDLARSLNNTQLGCNISTVLGSSLGIAGGTAVIGGIVLMPPVAIAGLVAGGAAAVTNLVTALAKYLIIKSRIRAARRLLQEDQLYYEKVRLAEREFNRVLENGSKPHSVDSAISCITVPVTGLKVGVAAAGLGVRSLKEAIHCSHHVMRHIISGVAGVGIALDLGVLLASAWDLAKGSKLHLAQHLRVTSDKLLHEIMDINRDFNSVYVTETYWIRSQKAIITPPALDNFSLDISDVEYEFCDDSDL